MIKNQYPLLLIGESLDRLGQAKSFTQFNLTSTYHRMRIKEGDKWKTAFRIRYRYFKYQVMQLELSNVPASFQDYINKILAKKLDIFVIVYLDDILIYTEDPGQGHVEAVRLVLDVLRRYGLFANLKKCQFYKDEVCFLGYIVSAQGVRMEDEQIKVVKNWPESTSVRDIQIFIGFTNFYQRFIQGFSRIAALLTSILKTTESSKESAPRAFRAGNNKVVEGSSGRADKMVVNLSKNKKSKKLTCVPNIGATGELHFLTFNAKKIFNYLRLTFIKAPIFRRFDLESHIQIETDASGFAIGRVLSQLNLNSDAPPNDSNLNRSDFSQWHIIASFSRKMISAKTQYKTHNAELLAIVEAFKTWRYYLEGCKHKVLVLTNYNNLRRFMDTKSLSFR